VPRQNLPDMLTQFVEQKIDDDIDDQIGMPTSNVLQIEPENEFMDMFNWYYGTPIEETPEFNDGKCQVIILDFHEDLELGEISLD
jgi:hypothetical protein